ncbi:hypothetical protein Angca_003901, partial [Angiostrongylus cantonensis]
VCCGFSRVLKMNGAVGIVPSYFLGLADIPGGTLAEQISYRRMWHTVVDEVVPTDYAVSPLTSNQTSPPGDKMSVVLDRRPLFIVPLTDQRVREGDNVLLLPQISSATAFTVIWRGPAVQAGRAQISSDNDSTCLTIFGVSALDDGAYSVVAENEYGITSSLAVISVITRPDAPTSIMCERIGRNALLLNWKPGPRRGPYYCVEFKSEGIPFLLLLLSHLHLRTRGYGPTYRLFQENALELPNSVILGGICGEGRFSVVYDAVLQKIQKSIVVKVLREKVTKEDVEREATILSTLHHSSMPRFKGVFTYNGCYCIAMKRMPGASITTFVDEFTCKTDSDGKFEEMLKHLSIDILSALSYLHARNIVHLDVNPSNLLVSDRLYLVDFGSARFLDDDDLQWGDGDIRYSAPERLDGNSPTTGSDIWSYGAVLFQLCFGATPHFLLTAMTTMTE